MLKTLRKTLKKSGDTVKGNLKLDQVYQTSIETLAMEIFQDYTQNDCEKAQEFLSYFSSFFTVENTEGGVPYFPKQEYQKELTNIMITRDKVLKKLKSIKTNKSPGPDRMHPRVLHEIADSIVDPITHIYCTSLKTMTLPAEWRHAIVTAIYKKAQKPSPQIIDLLV